MTDIGPLGVLKTGFDKLERSCKTDMAKKSLHFVFSNLGKLCDEESRIGNVSRHSDFQVIRRIRKYLYFYVIFELFVIFITRTVTKMYFSATKGNQLHDNFLCVCISIPLFDISGLLTVSMRSRWLDMNNGRHLLSIALEHNSKMSFWLEI